MFSEVSSHICCGTLSLYNSMSFVLSQSLEKFTIELTLLIRYVYNNLSKKYFWSNDVL
jgi:hypothetical protein